MFLFLSCRCLNNATQLFHRQFSKQKLIFEFRIGMFDFFPLLGLLCRVSLNVMIDITEAI